MRWTKIFLSFYFSRRGNNSNNPTYQFPCLDESQLIFEPVSLVFKTLLSGKFLLLIFLLNSSVVVIFKRHVTMLRVCKIAIQ